MGSYERNKDRADGGSSVLHGMKITPAALVSPDVNFQQRPFLANATMNSIEVVIVFRLFFIHVYPRPGFRFSVAVCLTLAANAVIVTIEPVWIWW